MAVLLRLFFRIVVHWFLNFGLYVGCHISVLNPRTPPQRKVVKGVKLILLLLTLFLDSRSHMMVFAEVGVLLLLFLCCQSLQSATVLLDLLFLSAELLIFLRHQFVKGFDLLHHTANADVQNWVRIPKFQDLLIFAYELFSAVFQLLLPAHDFLSQNFNLAVTLPNFNCLCWLSMCHVSGSFFFCLLTQFLLQCCILLLQSMDGLTEVVLRAGVIQRVIRNITVVFFLMLRCVGSGNEFPVFNNIHVRSQPVHVHYSVSASFIRSKYKFITLNKLH
jgi:hypothetical protein